MLPNEKLTLDKVLSPLIDKPVQAFMSNKVQVADLLEWILEQTGPADIWQTSFSISEEFIRRLYFLKNKKNLFNSFSLILDNKASKKTLKLWPFITKVIEKTFLADNHSKVMLIKAENNMRVSVITSQNLTRGNRFESSVIVTEYQNPDLPPPFLKRFIISYLR